MELDYDTFRFSLNSTALTYVRKKTICSVARVFFVWVQTIKLETKDPPYGKAEVVKRVSFFQVLNFTNSITQYTMPLV